MISTGIGLTLIGLIILGVGVAAIVLRTDEHQALMAVVKGPVQQIAGAPADTAVKLTGRVVQSEQDLVRSSLTEQQGVMVRTYVYNSTGMSGGTRRDYYREKHESEFYIDDGSGPLARIVPDGSAMYVPPRVLADDRFKTLDLGKPKDSSVTEETRTWLEQKTGRPMPNVISVEERVLAPGEQVCAIGPTAYRPGPAGSDELVLYHKGDQGVDALSISNMNQADLARHLAGQQMKRAALIGLGGAMVVAGVGLIVAGVLFP